MTSVRAFAAILGTVLMLAMPRLGPAQELRDVVADPDKLVEEALRAALLGQDTRLDRLVWECEVFERHNARPAPHSATLRENVAALAAARRRPLARARDMRALLDDRPADSEFDAFVQLIERTEPRDRLRIARDARRYEAWRQRVNAVTNAAAGLLTLQLFPLLQPPLDLLDYALVKRYYLSPEERREWHTARLVLATEGLSQAERANAASGLETATARRMATARLQARRNAEEAVRNGRLLDADWWYRREMLLAGSPRPLHDAHKEVIEARGIDVGRARQALVVRDGASVLGDPAQHAACRALLQALLLDPAAPTTLNQIQAFRARFPASPLVPATRVAEAAHARLLGNDPLARATLEDLAQQGDSSWSTRAGLYATRPDFHPRVAFDEARAVIAARYRDYILAGVNPRRHERHLSAEDARLIESDWIQSARSLFVFDILGRSITLVLLPSETFPREELFDALRAAPADFLQSPEGRDERRRVAHALRRMKRHEEAGRLFAGLGDADQARRQFERAARALVREADAAQDPRQRRELARRVLNAYPDTSAARRARLLERTATTELETILTLTPRELAAFPDLWRDGGLKLPGILFDGNRSNSEIDRDGLRLRVGGRVSFVDRNTGDEVVLAVDEAVIGRVVSEAFPRRRARAMAEELDKPRERKRIPVMVEGGAFPGFDAAPGLVPLEPDWRQRRLYE
ncbi:MAG: hypothetical protein KF858_08210 [Candidatus Sumerlaeia bacterium]|nr:hypothetical protein [Candidatus Sumerlaeia bacterium]